MKIKLIYPSGATPLDPDEVEGIVPKDISNQTQLNQVEQENITRGELWALGKRHKDLLSEAFTKKLHKKMFEDVWKWAGTFRLSNKSIGIDWHQIATELKKLYDDTEYWIKHDTFKGDWVELGARFHHRLVWIHPFPNGNGRFSRTYTDLLLEAYEQPQFSWGRNSFSGKIEDEGPMRDGYIIALRDGDKKNYKKLIEFVKS